MFDLLSPVNPRLRIKEINHYKVRTQQIDPQVSSSGRILYLHGGAYVLGMTNNHINLCGTIAERSQMAVFLPHYHLAPEHPYPCALEDVFSVYCSMTSTIEAESPVFIGGDSAGGGLALALLQKIIENGEVIPNGIFLFSPWTDLTLSGNSVIENSAVDPVLTESGLNADARAYAGDYPLDEPYISPLFCDLKNFPPLLIQAGSEEILLDDSRSLAIRAEAQGGNVSLSVWEDMFHVFQVFPMLAESEQAIDEVVDFIEKYS